MKSTRVICLWALAVLLAVAPAAHAINVNDVDDFGLRVTTENVEMLAKILGCQGQPWCADMAKSMMKDEKHAVARNFLQTQVCNSSGNLSDCPWTYYRQSEWYQYDTYREYIYNESCEIFEEPPKPWPSEWGWSKISAWKDESDENEKKYYQYWDDYYKAKANATYYMPYDREKCNAVGGQKQWYYTVPVRYMQTFEIQNCTHTYPESADADTNTDTDVVDLTGEVNPVPGHTGWQGAGMVPSPMQK